MSPHSSSASWSEEGGGRHGGDIIDLDRFMRGHVRPPTGAARQIGSDHRGQQLVVDAGGISRPPAPPHHNASDATMSLLSRDSATVTHDKRASHDSGLSDGSYGRRRRGHRRGYGGGDATAGRQQRRHHSHAGHNHGSHHRGHASHGGGHLSHDSASGSAAGSARALLAFRAKCERELKDHKQQIARVAQIAERLAERMPLSAASPSAAAAPPRAPSSSSDSSDVTSYSGTTTERPPNRRGKQRSDSCKTYKIIMSKLDELSRLYAHRPNLPPPPLPLPRGRPARLVARDSRTSASVSVRDKVVATDTPAAEKRFVPRIVTPTVQARAPTLVERAVGDESARWMDAAAAGPGHDAGAAAESIQYRSTSKESGSSRVGPPCPYDLDNPVNLYAQAKRLQTLHATTRRARSAGPPAPSLDHARKRKTTASHKSASTSGADSLCGVCRGYWRALRDCVAAQLFCNVVGGK